MAIEVKIPSMGESITSGVLAKWHVKGSDIVKKDQLLFELETDKITSESTAESAGKIFLKVEPGTEVKIGQVVAIIDETTIASAGDPDHTTEVKGEAKATQKSNAQSPAVRRLAAESSIDPASIEGSGKGGRVTKGDILAAAEKAPATPLADSMPDLMPDLAAASKHAAPVATGDRHIVTKMTKLRQTIADRLVATQHEAAMLTTFNECDMSAVIELRKKHQADFTQKNGVKLGFMSFFTKAVVYALKEVPRINARIDNDAIVQNRYYDISIAVSVDKGLMVPVIRDCDSLSMASIEKAIGDAAKKACDGKITLADLESGVFTITNGGIFGSMLSTPIINAPQSAILGLHAISERPVAVNGQVVIRPMMYLALSYDHRLIDGKEAVTFLIKVKQAIEDPYYLFILA